MNDGSETTALTDDPSETEGWEEQKYNGKKCLESRCFMVISERMD